MFFLQGPCRTPPGESDGTRRCSEKSGPRAGPPAPSPVRTKIVPLGVADMAEARMAATGQAARNLHKQLALQTVVFLGRRHEGNTRPVVQRHRPGGLPQAIPPSIRVEFQRFPALLLKQTQENRLGYPAAAIAHGITSIGSPAAEVRSWSRTSKSSDVKRQSTKQCLAPRHQDTKTPIHQDNDNGLGRARMSRTKRTSKHFNAPLRHDDIAIALVKRSALSLMGVSTA